LTWYYETVAGAVRHGFRVDKELYRGRTAFQEVEIFENELYGRVLALDGVAQTSERDEYLYHEMIVHVPMFGHGRARDVLVIGGGDGGSIREVLRHPVDHVTMVDIDGELVELCREYLPSISDGAFEDPRLELLVGDGTAYVAETERRFDVIVIDSTDPVGPGVVLFQTPFYENCRRILKPGGIISHQWCTPFTYPYVIRMVHPVVKATFPHVGVYVAPIPLYGGGHMSFGWSSMDLDLEGVGLDELRSRYEAAGIETRRYSPEYHRGAMMLPPDILALMN